MKLSVHPLFFAFGLYFALTGKVFLFLTATLTALVHELGHAYYAERLGYKLNKISLMPYGATVNGAIDGLSCADEILIALFGPLVNLFVCLIFTALWWLVPETYTYTDSVVFSNLSVACINLLPAYPLDGGRIFCALLCGKLPYNKALLIVKILGVTLSIITFALFVFSCFNTINFTVLFFSAFIFVGAVTKTKEKNYVKIFKNRTEFLCGVKQERHFVANGDITLKQLLQHVSGDYFFTLEIVDKKSGRNKKLNRTQTENLLASYRYYDTLSDLIDL